MKVNKLLLDKLKIWWNLSYEHGNTEIYNECEEFCYNVIGKHIEVWKYKKYGSWGDLKMNDLCYIPQNYLNTNGIIEHYYTKDNIQEICNDNKIIGRYVFRYIKGELVEDYFNNLKQQYYEYFMYEPTANIYKSDLSLMMFQALNTKQQEEIYTVINKRTGRRFNTEYEI